MKHITLKPGKEKPFLHGEPLIFSGAIARAASRPAAAELVAVYSAKERFIGVGTFNPHSSYRVRLLSFEETALDASIDDLLTTNMKRALQRRTQYDLPSPQTNAYRAINSEADGLSGLTIDIFADTAVAVVTAYWTMHYRANIERCWHALGLPKLHWRPNIRSLQQDGWHTATENEAAVNTLQTIRENDLLYQVDLTGGQKTGFYCDQRDNRMLLRSLAENKTVLDCCCYSGGFALNAAMGGATSVLGIDSSQAAIELARTNAALNQLTQVQFETGKIEDVLADEKPYDIIILDPPKLAPNQKSLAAAKQRYLKLNQMALAKLPSGGLLFTCSCSNALDEASFLELLQLAAKKAQKKIKVLAVHGAAPDHPYLPQAQYGAYLKAVLLEIK